MIETIIASKLENIDTQIAQLKETLEQQKAYRKQILAQQRKIQDTIAAVTELRKSLSDDLLAEFENAIGNSNTDIPVFENALSPSNSEFCVFKTQKPSLVEATIIEKEDEQAELAPFPKKEPKTTEDELFSWQTTTNSYVTSFFDVRKGKLHCAYLGGDNKSHLERWLVTLQSWMPGIRVQNRLAQRLDSKYELKIWWGDAPGDAIDEIVGFLAGSYHPKKPPVLSLMSRLEDCPESSLQGQCFHLACLMEDGKLQPGDVVTHFRRPQHGMLVCHVEGNTAIVREFRFTASGNFKEAVDYQYPLSELTRQPLNSTIALITFEMRSKALQSQKRLSATQIEALASLPR